MLGSNPVYVFTGGTVRVGSWLRFVSTDPYQFFDNFTDLNEIRHPARSHVGRVPSQRRRHRQLELTSQVVVRVGLIGTSWWADAMYLPPLSAHPERGGGRRVRPQRGDDGGLRRPVAHR